MAVTLLTKNLAVEREVRDYVFDFTPEASTGTTEEFVMNFPTGSYLVLAVVQCIVADTVAGSSRLNLNVAPTLNATASTLAFFGSTADNGGALGIDYGFTTTRTRPLPTDITGGAVPFSLLAETVYSGTATIKPSWRCMVRAFRPEYTL